MKRIDRPAVDDHAALHLLVTRKRLKSYPKLAEVYENLVAAYDTYLQHQGNACLIVADPAIVAPYKDYLSDHFDCPPAAVAYVTQMRLDGEGKSCPMCGSAGAGTLDHVLPRDSYPEFSLFSLNLVPACKCNSLRQNDVIGPVAGQRVLHPYFDDILQSRLVRMEFAGPFHVVPRISIEVAIPNTNPLWPAVDFHIENVVRRTAILRQALTNWQKLREDARIVLPKLPAPPVTVQQIIDAIDDEVARLDKYYDSLNNWSSVFVDGLRDLDLLNWLCAHYNGPGPDLL